MLGRSRQGDKLSPDERRALEHVDAPKPSGGSQVPAAAPVVKVARDRLTWSWTRVFPGHFPTLSSLECKRRRWMAQLLAGRLPLHLEGRRCGKFT